MQSHYSNPPLMMIGDKSNSVKRLRTWWGTWNPFTLNNFFNVNPMMGLVSSMINSNRNVIEIELRA